jgi:class 3 adenylate cyclase
MMETVAALSQNPLNMFRAEYQTKAFDVEKEGKCRAKKDYARAEIRVLEQAFRKIGVMLVLVYGSAGSEMITNSIRSAGELTPLTSGREILAIFCFAKISGFSDLLDSLGPHVLKYMHIVSRLVHSQSEKYSGSVNRNLGDSYLLVWKFPQEDVVLVRNKFVVNAYSDHVRQTTSLALLSAIKSIYKVVKSSALRPYHQNPTFTGALYPELTFGFHVGWAYEGPIGSMFKIDASYLSPNVNIASRVESACKQYRVKILCSEEFAVRLDPTVQTYLRHVDTVTLKGVHLPLELHCFDLDTSGLVTLSHSKPTKSRIERQRRKLQAAMSSGLFHVQALFTSSEDLSLMRQPYTAAFLSSFKEAVLTYLAGEWKKAKTGLEACLEVRPEDGPSQNLLEYMRSAGWTAPGGWLGFRELHEK